MKINKYKFLFITAVIAMPLSFRPKWRNLLNYAKVPKILRLLPVDRQVAQDDMGFTAMTITSYQKMPVNAKKIKLIKQDIYPKRIDK